MPALCVLLASLIAQAFRSIRRGARAFASLFAILALSCAPLAPNHEPPRAGTVFYHADHLGGVALQTDAQGAVLATRSYDPYGAELVHASEPYGYTGKEYEPDTGLYDFAARAYDPVIGRFISPDPLAVESPSFAESRPRELNPYAYAAGDPVGNTDPSGMSTNRYGQEFVGPANPDPAAHEYETRTGWLSWKDSPATSSLVQPDDLFGIKGLAVGGVKLAAMLGKAGIGAVKGVGAAVVARGAREVGESGGSAFARYMKLADTLDVSTAKNAAVFYSGKGNRELAERFALSNGRTTLEMTPGGKWLDAQKLFETGSPLIPRQAQQVWARVSERYASSASGNAVGFVRGAKPTSIFSAVEYPTLHANPNITNVITGGY